MKNLIYKRHRSAVKLIVILCVIFLTVTLAVFPEKYSKSTYNGVLLWAISVMPSLLPYFFLTAILTKTNSLTNAFYKLSPITNKCFRLSGISIYAFLMSVLSGYPVGSKLVSDLYLGKIISKGEASRMSVLCSTSGPLFIIGAVGTGMFLNKTVGFIIYLTHVLSAIITALILRNAFEPPFNNQISINAQKSDNFLYDAVYSSVISVLVVGGFISIFYVISEILIDFNILYPLTFLVKILLSPLSPSGVEAQSLSAGLIEFTKGCKNLSLIGTTPLTVSLACFLITFGGISAILQSLAFLKKAKVNGLFFIAGKLVQAIIAFTLCYISCLIFL